MGHNFPAPTAEILSGPGAEREGMSECLNVRMSAVWVLLICDTRHMMETSQLLWEFKRGEKRQREVYSHSQFDLFVYRLDLFIK